MTLETFAWDSAEHLDSAEAVAAYLEAVIEDGDPGLFAHALGQIARARGMTDIARQAGVTREALYKSLRTDGDPRLTTLFGVMKALGLKITVEPIQSPPAAA
jgi:probable addiction module antidote protein